ncbi:MAG: killer suppression protein [Candidatus Eisenbacteria bacterium]
MDILFKNDALRDVLTKHKKTVQKFGDRQARKLRRRLDDLRAAPSLEAMRRLPGRCHELRGDRKDYLSLDLVHPRRLLFVPATDPAPVKPDGGLDWSGVRAVRVLGVEDTHE